jgi:hypothetical protein
MRIMAGANIVCFPTAQAAQSLPTGSVRIGSEFPCFKRIEANALCTRDDVDRPVLPGRRLPTPDSGQRCIFARCALRVGEIRATSAEILPTGIQAIKAKRENSIHVSTGTPAMGRAQARRTGSHR